MVDDRDELEEALKTKDITKKQYQLALDTSEKLQAGLLCDIEYALLRKILLFVELLKPQLISFLYLIS